MSPGACAPGLVFLCSLCNTSSVKTGNAASPRPAHLTPNPKDETMSKLRFSDGMEIDTDGELRIVRKRDGLYVVGQGMCCPVDSPAEGRALIAKLARKR